jgi:hypothetical protein
MEVIHKIDEKGRKKGCPWGRNCNTCNLYRPTYVNKRDGSTAQEFDCQANNLVLFLGELKDKTIVLQQAIESSRNENIKRQDIFNKIVEDGSAEAQKKIDRAIEDQKRLS